MQVCGAAVRVPGHIFMYSSDGRKERWQDMQLVQLLWRTMRCEGHAVKAITLSSEMQLFLV